MNSPEKGYLTVRTYSASGAFPVPGAVAVIRSQGENGRNVVRNVYITNEDGETETTEFDTPPRSNSLSPGSENVCAFCTVEITAQGFYSVSAFNVPVYAGTLSIQPFAMIPVSLSGKDLYPVLNTVVYEGTLPNL